MTVNFQNNNEIFDSKSQPLKNYPDNEKSYNFILRPEIETLRIHKEFLSACSIKKLFSDDFMRFEKLKISIPGILFDYSKNHVIQETMDIMVSLAEAANVESWRDRMLAGEIINNTECRSVLHTALRGSIPDGTVVGGENVPGFVEYTQDKIRTFSDSIRSNKEITDIVNIGIGGSDLGPKLACEALSHFSTGPRCHFVSNLDGQAFSSTLSGLKPQNTHFIIASKTFSTLETIANAEKAKSWMIAALGPDAVEKHFSAVSTNIPAVKSFGIADQNIFPLRDWIGGRYSIWSSIGLSIAISIGSDKFKDFLDGAHHMDRHFQETPLRYNMPVIAALLGIWHRNICNYSTQAILPYAHALRSFPAFLQQLDMESNGKGVTRHGNPLSYLTGPVIFGLAGTDGQHAFMQLLHQSREIIPSDFIIIKEAIDADKEAHRKLNANAIAQAQALMEGKDFPGEPYRNCPGNRPSSTLVLDRLDPYHLGLLLAFYEHKIFVQGIIWDINSFDQWGVELGKILARNITSKNNVASMDSSTRNLIAYTGI